MQSFWARKKAVWPSELFRCQAEQRWLMKHLSRDGKKQLSKTVPCLNNRKNTFSKSCARFLLKTLLVIFKVSDLTWLNSGISRAAEEGTCVLSSRCVCRQSRNSSQGKLHINILFRMAHLKTKNLIKFKYNCHVTAEICHLSVYLSMTISLFTYSLLGDFFLCLSYLCDIQTFIQSFIHSISTE